MRVRPDGLELLQAAQSVLGTAIVPHLAHELRDSVRVIAKTMTQAEELLARDAKPSPADLAALDRAYAKMRGDVLKALPADRRYDARLIAKAIAVASRQLANGHEPERREMDHLAALLGLPSCASDRADDVRCALSSLNTRLAERIRSGAADPGTSAHAETLAHLQAITTAALSESNPGYRSLPPVAAMNDVRPPAIPDQVELWFTFGNAVGDAMIASSNAALATQTGLFGWFTQRLAANPRVPMLAVEGAHQAHDLSVAIADTTAAFYMLALAPFRVRRAEARFAEVTRLSS